MPGSSLYQRILGSDFAKLPTGLQRFHGAAGAARGAGIATVRSGSGVLHRLLARLMGLPRPGENIPIELAVTLDGDREIWWRSFGGRPFTTVQWQNGTLLAERSGPALFYFTLGADAAGLRFEHRGSRIFGVPIPLALSPRVEADAIASGDGWDLRVTIAMPIVGMITSYTGHIVQTQ
jgi:hypothetical protein